MENDINLSGLMPECKADLTEMVLEGHSLSDLCKKIGEDMNVSPTAIRYQWIIDNWDWVKDVITVTPRKTIAKITILTIQMEDQWGVDPFNVTSSSLGERKKVFDLCVTLIDSE